jgi:hypothetical protein
MIAVFRENEARNSFWQEGDLWYGYSYNDHLGRFIFDDTGHESFVDILNQVYGDGE